MAGDDCAGWIFDMVDMEMISRGLMRAAGKAAKVMEGWSDSKRKYAARITGVLASPADGGWKMSEIIDREYYEGLLAEVVRERENYNGMHQLACMEIERLQKVRLIAEDVVWYDWSNNDSDAVHTMEQLRLALAALTLQDGKQS